MAVVPRKRNAINDTTPMICTIQGIAKKDHVVRVTVQLADNVSTYFDPCIRMLDIFSSLVYLVGLHHESSKGNQSR